MINQAKNTICILTPKVGTTLFYKNKYKTLKPAVNFENPFKNILINIYVRKLITPEKANGSQLIPYN